MTPTCLSINGTEFNCGQAVPVGTVAKLTCKTAYRRPDFHIQDAYKCQENGHWNAPAFKCIPICGVEVEASPFISGGNPSFIGAVPWHAGIYEQQQINKAPLQICGGTIISETAVVSAAHCFWDGKRDKVKDLSLFSVAVGKTFRDLNHKEATNVVFRVLRIKTLDQYNDYQGNYAGDIAVAVLHKPILFHALVKPICLEFGTVGNEQALDVSIRGRVAGWGLTSSNGVASEQLKVIELPAVDYHSCVRNSPRLKDYLTTDKFCAGYAGTDQGVCLGDSGGGYVVPKIFGERQRKLRVFYLRGIVSVGPNLNGSCDPSQYTTFTDVSKHREPFLLEFIN